MQHRQLEMSGGFRVVTGNPRSEAAVMVLQPGETVGGPGNRHGTSDQWLFVVDGEGEALVERERRELRRGTLLLIEAGESHEIRNTGSGPLETLNVYVPPEYRFA